LRNSHRSLSVFLRSGREPTKSGVRRHDWASRPLRVVERHRRDIQLDIRYRTSNNFVGRPIAGYPKPRCILTEDAATALSRAQKQANAHGYSLKVYDCYRPRRAVADFVAWAADPSDTRMQHRFYPAVPKGELFARGYIAAKSGHSRGSTMDLTLVPIGSRQPAVEASADLFDCRSDVLRRYPDNSIDMGTGFDCLDELAHTESPRISPVARRNRDLLRSIMRRAGFVNLAEEWWHFTLEDEPFPETYFDFVVE
jgi:zinc D-Ala-D-Ala dipeptidase